MQQTVTTRIPIETLKEIERLAKSDNIDRSAEVRQLLEVGIFEKKQDEVIERYRQGKISTSRGAKELGITIWEMEEILDSEHIEAQYGSKDLKHDLEESGKK